MGESTSDELRTDSSQGGNGTARLRGNGTARLRGTGTARLLAWRPWGDDPDAWRRTVGTFSLRLGLLAALILLGSRALPRGKEEVVVADFHDSTDWSEVSEQACGEVTTFDELAAAEGHERVDSCVAQLLVRAHARGDVEAWVMRAPVDAAEAADALELVPGSPVVDDEPDDELQVLVVRSADPAFVADTAAGSGGGPRDVIAAWYPAGSRPHEVGSVLLSSGSDAYEALHRLIGG